MSFLLDVLALFILGFLVEDLNHILVIFLNRLWTRGDSRLFPLSAGVLIIALFWLVSGLLYLDKLSFFGLKGSDWMLNSGLPIGLTKTPTTDIAAIILFALYPAWFILGRRTAERRFNEFPKILEAFTNAMIPYGGAITLGAKELNSAEATMQYIKTLVPSYKEGVKLLTIVLDSLLLTFILSWKTKRFINLKPSQQSEYLEDLEASRHTRPIALAFRSFLIEGYYTKPEVWKAIRYDGALREKFQDEVPWHTSDPNVRSKWFGSVAK